MKPKNMKQVPLKHTALTKVWPYVQKYYAKYGFMPTDREIALHFHYRSAWTGNLLKKELVKAGLIKIYKHKARGMALK